MIAGKRGRVIQHAPVAEVMTPGALRAIYDVDVHVEEIRGKPIGVYYG